ncbi:hypothetical protein ACQKL5_13485 [Peribacillus sp. NPDC097675]|uniref:hypothetical protein n=1 Tax=Peribacillus sp. NPDC097675 TaxID=3390618 RepID=UPI003D0943B2
MSNSVSIPRPPDVVTILWERNPLKPQSSRRIVEASVIGSAEPCKLSTGRCYRKAVNCLLDNGFVRVTNTHYDVFGVAVFVRLF